MSHDLARPHDDWLPSMESVAWVLPLEETGDPSLVDSWRTNMMDIYGYDSGNDSRNFQRTFHEHQTFQMTSLLMMLALKNLRVGKPWASTQDSHSSLWFLNATYTCIMHRSIESIRTDSCPKKKFLNCPFTHDHAKPHANMTKRPLPRINHDTPSYNLNNMKTS